MNPTAFRLKLEKTKIENAQRSKTKRAIIKNLKYKKRKYKKIKPFDSIHTNWHFTHLFRQLADPKWTLSKSIFSKKNSTAS